MKFEGIIKIEKAIVHILNPKDKSHKLSDFELDTNEKLNNLIVGHINNSYRNDSRIFVKFDGENNIVRESCINILKDDNNFINESKDISRELFKSMQGTNAPAANFLIVRYRHGNEKAVALLKLDFNDNFYTEEKKENGKVKIDVKIKGAGFYSKQKLQKCAFIYDDILSDKKSNILVLDKQSKKDMSDYFGIRFLNSILVNDNKRNTKNMINELVNFINKKYEDNAKEQMDKTYEVSKLFANNNEKFNLESALDKVFESEEYKEEFKNQIQNKPLDYEFNIDKKTSEKRLTRRSITTTNGIELKAQASFFNNRDIQINESEESEFVDIIIKKVKICDNKL